MKFISPLLTKVIVKGGKNDQLREGTTGFVSSVKFLPNNNINTFLYKIIVTRIGKGGKPRLAIAEFFDEVIDTSELSSAQRSTLSSNIAKDYGLKSTYREDKGRLVGVDIQKNILNMDTRDFLAYLTAYSSILAMFGKLYVGEDFLRNVPMLRLPRPTRETILETVPSSIPPKNFSTYVLTAYAHDESLKTDIHMSVFDNFFDTVKNPLGKRNREYTMDNFHENAVLILKLLKEFSIALEEKKKFVRSRMDELFHVTGTEL